MIRDLLTLLGINAIAVLGAWAGGLYRRRNTPRGPWLDQREDQ
jgi:hypothetical protein